MKPITFPKIGFWLFIIGFVLYGLLMTSCSKQQVRHTERWQVQHLTSAESGAWCLPAVPVYDTITIYWNISNPDDSYIRVGYCTRENNYYYDNLYHYIYYEKQIN